MAARGERFAADPLDVTGLKPLMEITAGDSAIAVGLIDGPVGSHPDLAADHIRTISAAADGATGGTGAAGAHGVYVAGILAARRSSAAPALCPDCTLLVRPIFFQSAEDSVGAMPSATPDDVADAIAECVDAGSRVINLSVAVAQPSPNRERRLEEALNYAACKGAIVIAATGNQGTIGSSAITGHVWVIPVAACDLHGRPLGTSNLAASSGRRGLRAPGDQITSLGAEGDLVTSGGTSAAAPFVTGTLALLWSVFPAATVTDIKRAVTQARAPSRRTIVPPLLDAWAAYQMMAATQSRRMTA